MAEAPLKSDNLGGIAKKPSVILSTGLEFIVLYSYFAYTLAVRITEAHI